MVDLYWVRVKDCETGKDVEISPDPVPFAEALRLLRQVALPVWRTEYLEPANDWQREVK